MERLQPREKVFRIGCKSMWGVPWTDSSLWCRSRGECAHGKIAPRVDEQGAGDTGIAGNSELRVVPLRPMASLPVEDDPMPDMPRGRRVSGQSREQTEKGSSGCRTARRVPRVERSICKALNQTPLYG